jgi:hypothetical protein
MRSVTSAIDEHLERIAEPRRKQARVHAFGAGTLVEAKPEVIED